VLVDASATATLRARLHDARGGDSSGRVALFRPWPVTHEDLARLMRPVAVRVDELAANPPAIEGA
jgi:hypothetical protein